MSEANNINNEIIKIDLEELSQRRNNLMLMESSDEEQERENSFQMKTESENKIRNLTSNIVALKSKGKMVFFN